MRRPRLVELPAIAEAPGVRIVPVLEGERVIHAAIVDGGLSRRDMEMAKERAFATMRDMPEQLRHIEIKIDAGSMRRIAEAEARRRARAAKRAGRK